MAGATLAKAEIEKDDKDGCNIRLAMCANGRVCISHMGNTSTNANTSTNSRQRRQRRLSFSRSLILSLFLFLNLNLSLGLGFRLGLGLAVGPRLITARRPSHCGFSLPSVCQSTLREKVWLLAGTSGLIAMKFCLEVL